MSGKKAVLMERLVNPQLEDINRTRTQQGKVNDFWLVASHTPNNLLFKGSNHHYFSNKCCNTPPHCVATLSIHIQIDIQLL